MTIAQLSKIDRPGAELADPGAGAEKEAIPGAVSEAGSHVTVITPPDGSRFIDFGELWRFRDLLYFLAWRDV